MCLPRSNVMSDQTTRSTRSMVIREIEGHKFELVHQHPLQLARTLPINIVSTIDFSFDARSRTP